MNQQEKELRNEQYFPGTDIPDAFAELMRPASKEVFASCIPDAFYPDGTPVAQDPQTIYPYQAAWILGTSIPWEFANIERYYRQAATRAAWQHMARMFPGTVNPFAEREWMDGFSVEYAGFRFLIPEYITNPMVVIPDSADNSDLWEENRVPIYILQQVRLYMALIRLHHNGYGKDLPGIYVVRVFGNLTADIDIRWVASNPILENAILESVCDTLTRRIQGGLSLLPEANILQKKNWCEILTDRMDEAEVTHDEVLHNKITKYMEIRADRKALEKQVKEMKAEEDAIAARLVNLIPNAKMGKVVDPYVNKTYTIRHNKSRDSSPRITPALIRTFAPEFSGFAIITNENAKGRVEIDAV